MSEFPVYKKPNIFEIYPVTIRIYITENIHQACTKDSLRSMTVDDGRWKSRIDTIENLCFTMKKGVIDKPFDYICFNSLSDCVGKVSSLVKQD